jgi:hypothetical protein
MSEFIMNQWFEVQGGRELRESAIFPGEGSVVLTAGRLAEKCVFCRRLDRREHTSFWKIWG